MSNKLFVGGLAYSTTEIELVDEMRKYGTIVSSRLILDPHTGKSKGFAFITFSNKEEAQSAMESLDGKEFGGRVIGVKPAIDKRHRESQ